SELTRLLPASGGRVEQAMAYTALAPSKQVRAVLVMLCAELCRGHVDRAVPAACAIELVHASSLILDDLPSMDDAPLRRGRRASSPHNRRGPPLARPRRAARRPTGCANCPPSSRRAADRGRGEATDGGPRIEGDGWQTTDSRPRMNTDEHG